MIKIKKRPFTLLDIAKNNSMSLYIPLAENCDLNFCRLFSIDKHIFYLTASSIQLIDDSWYKIEFEKTDKNFLDCINPSNNISIPIIGSPYCINIVDNKIMISSQYKRNFEFAEAQTFCIN